jgi:hypothetical protein
MTTTAIGMTFDTQFLEYISTDPGTTFPSVTADLQGTSQMVITGTSANGFSGSGSFAIITFKIIAAGPGSTSLCTLFNPATPTSTPTTAPTTPPSGPTSTPTPTITPGGPTLTPTPTSLATPTSPPPPTSLPQSGFTAQIGGGVLFGFVAVALMTLGFVVFKKT